MRSGIAGRDRNSCGYTLVEMTASSAILVVAVTLALYGFVYAWRTSKESSTQTKLDIEVQNSMEYVKNSIRLACLTNMFFYPDGPGPYTSISVPVPGIETNGTIKLNPTNGMIIWVQDIIYHRWEGTPNKLLLTTVPRTNPSSAFLQAQLATVSTNPLFSTNGTIGAYQTRELFANIFEWRVWSRGSFYDAYDTEPGRVRVDLGSMFLTPGSHQFQFKCVGKHASSTGYRIGLDTLKVSRTGILGEREAEEQITNSVVVSGPALTNSYMSGGSWSHNRQLLFGASASNQSFVITMWNDRWEEVNFRTAGEVFDDTELFWDVGSISSPWPPAPYTTDMVVRLAGIPGNDWYANEQTGAKAAGYTNGLPDLTDSLRGCAVRIPIKGGDMGDGGFIPQNSGKNFFYMQGPIGGVGEIWVDEAYLSLADNTTNLTSDARAGTFHRLTSSQGTSWRLPSGPTNQLTAWCLPCGYRHAISKDETYMLTFLVNGAAGKGRAQYWPEMKEPSGIGCWILPSASSADAQNPVWSTNTAVFSTNRLYHLSTVHMYYPTNGYYVSAPFDTKMTAVSNCTVAWTADVPSGCAVSLQVRGGTNDDAMTTQSWNNVAAITTPGTTTNLGNNRYIQFRARLQPDAWFDYTPKLHGVVIGWTGQPRVVDIGGIVTVGPNYGRWELRVDSNVLTRSVQVDMSIFSDLNTRYGLKRITSDLTTEIRPRNTGR